MIKKTQQREHFLDSIRAHLMLLGVPFHVSLIYSSHNWAVNSTDTSKWLTLFNDFIHSFRMQVFFVISGYFSYMLFLRYTPSDWLMVRLKRLGIPMLTAIPLITLPQFFLLKECTSKIADWNKLTLYQRYNLLVWDLISHLWFLLVLILLIVASFWLFRILRDLQQEKINYSELNWGKLTLCFLLYSLIWIIFRHLIFIFSQKILEDALFNMVVMNTLFYLPFFMLGALAWKYTAIKELFIRPVPLIFIGSVLTFIAYMANQTWSNSQWLYEIDALVSMITGLWMINVVFSFGHRLLYFHSPRITYLVNASLFIYLVHHPLTIAYGIWVVPLIVNNTLSFFVGVLFVFGISFLLYEIHLRIPLLRFLFSGKPQHK